MALECSRLLCQYFNANFPVFNYLAILLFSEIAMSAKGKIGFGLSS